MGNSLSLRRAVAVAGLLALLLIPSAAGAAQPAGFSVSPKKPLDSQVIKVVWRPSKQPPTGSYRLDLVTGDSNTCVSSRNVALTFRWRPGATIRATLRPTADKKYWCPGAARVRLFRRKGHNTTLYEAASIVIEDNSSTENPGPNGTPAKVTLLEGSSMTVKVAGRPDRTSGLTGELRGYIPGKFRPNTDIQITLTRGSISATSLPGDPACTPAGRQYPSAIGLYVTPVYPGTLKPTETLLSGQTMTLLASGSGSLVLTLDQDYVAALTGCKSAGGDAASFPVGFAGQVGPTGLVQFTITGGTDGLKLSDGATASVVFTLVLKIDLSGK